MPSIRDAFLNGVARLRGMRRQSRLPEGWQSPAVDPDDSYELVPAEPAELPQPTETEQALAGADEVMRRFNIPQLSPEDDARVRADALAAKTPEELDAVIRGPQPELDPYQKRYMEAPWYDKAVPMSMRALGGFGGMVGKIPTPATAALGALTGAGGEGYAQAYEMLRGFRKPETNYKALGVGALMGGVVPSGMRFLPGGPARIPAQMAQGAAMSAAGGELYRRAEDMPTTTDNVMLDALIGAAVGLPMGVADAWRTQRFIKQGEFVPQRGLVRYTGDLGEPTGEVIEGSVVRPELGAGDVAGTALPPPSFRTGPGPVDTRWRPGDQLAGNEPAGPIPGRARIVPPGTPVRPYRWGEYPDLGDSEAIALLEDVIPPLRHPQQPEGFLPGGGPVFGPQTRGIPLPGQVANPDTVVGPSPIEPPPTPPRVRTPLDAAADPDPQLRQAFIDAVMRGDMALARQLGEQVGQRADLAARFFQIPPEVPPPTPVPAQLVPLPRPVNVMGRAVNAVEFDPEGGMISLIFGSEPNQRLKVAPAQYGAFREIDQRLPEPPRMERPQPRDRFDIFPPEEREAMRQRTAQAEAEQAAGKLVFDGPRRLPIDAEAEGLDALARELGLELPVPAETRLTRRQMGQPAAQPSMPLAPLDRLTGRAPVGQPVPTGMMADAPPPRPSLTLGRPPTAPLPPAAPPQAPPAPSGALARPVEPPPAALAPEAPPAASTGPDPDPEFEALYQRARYDGFTGTREELRAAKASFDSFNEDMDIAGETANDPTALLQQVARYGGLDWDEGFPGETQWLWESSSAFVPGKKRKDGRIARGRTMPVGGIRGVKGVMRKGGLTIDQLREAISQEPQFAWLKDASAADFVNALQEAAGREAQAKGRLAPKGQWWEPFVDNPAQREAAQIAELSIDDLAAEFNAGLPRYELGELEGPELTRFEAIQKRVMELMEEEAGEAPPRAPLADDDSFDPNALDESQPSALAPAPEAPPVEAPPRTLEELLAGRRVENALPGEPELRERLMPAQEKFEQLKARMAAGQEKNAREAGVSAEGVTRVPEPEPPPVIDEELLDTELAGAIELGQIKEFSPRELAILADAIDVKLTEIRRLIINQDLLADDPRVVRALNDIAVMRDPALEIERAGAKKTPPPPEPPADLGALVDVPPKAPAPEAPPAAAAEPPSDASPDEAQSIMGELAAAGDRAERAAAVPPEELDRLIDRATLRAIQGKTARERAEAKQTLVELQKLKAREAGKDVPATTVKPASSTPTGELEGMLFNTEKKPDLFAPPSAEDLADAAPTELTIHDLPPEAPQAKAPEDVGELVGVPKAEASVEADLARYTTLDAEIEALKAKEKKLKIGSPERRAVTEQIDAAVEQMGVLTRRLEDAGEPRPYNARDYADGSLSELELARQKYFDIEFRLSEANRVGKTALARGLTQDLEEVRQQIGREFGEAERARLLDDTPDTPDRAPVADEGDDLIPNDDVPDDVIDEPALTTYEQLADNRRDFLVRQLKFSPEDINRMSVDEAIALGERARTEGIEAVRNPNWQAPRHQVVRDPGETLWKIRDTETGEVVRSGFRSRRVAADIANELEAPPPPPKTPPSVKAAPVVEPPAAAPTVPARVPKRGEPQSLEELLEVYSAEDAPRKLEQIRERQRKAQLAGGRERFPAIRTPEQEGGQPPRRLEPPTAIARKAEIPESEEVRRGRVNPREEGTNPRMNEKRAEKMKELIANPSKKNLDEYAKFLLAQAERENAIQLRGGTGKEPKGDVKFGEDMPHLKYDAEKGEYLGSGFGGLQQLWEKNPALFGSIIRSGLGAFAGYQYAESEDRDPWLYMLAGAAGAKYLLSPGARSTIYREGSKVTYKFAPEMFDKALASRLSTILEQDLPAYREYSKAAKEVAQEWKQIQAFAKQRGVQDVRWTRDVMRDLNLLEMFRQPHAVFPDLFNRIFPDFEAFMAAEAEMPSVTPEMRAWTRKTYLVDALAEVRKAARQAKDNGQPRAERYLKAYAEQLAGKPIVMADLLGKFGLMGKDARSWNRSLSNMGNWIYRSTIGWAMDTALVNRGQFLLNAPQLGFRNTIKGMRASRTPEGRAQTEFLQYHQMPELDAELEGAAGKLHEFVQKYDQYAFAPMKGGDNANRSASFKAAFDYGRTKGLNAEQAREWALLMTFQSQGMPGALGENPILRQLGPMRALARYTTTFMEFTYDMATHPDPKVSARAMGAALGAGLLGQAIGINLLNLWVPRMVSVVGPGKDAIGDVYDHMAQLWGAAPPDHTLKDDLLTEVIPRYPREVYSAARDAIEYGMEPRPVVDRYAQQIAERSPYEDLAGLVGVDLTEPQKRRDERSRMWDYERQVQRRRTGERRERYGALREGLRSRDDTAISDALEQMSPSQRRAWQRGQMLDPRGRIRRRLPRDEREAFDEQFPEEQP